MYAKQHIKYVFYQLLYNSFYSLHNIAVNIEAEHFKVIIFLRNTWTLNSALCN